MENLGVFLIGLGGEQKQDENFKNKIFNAEYEKKSQIMD